jgi:hypothetical protein
VDSPRLDDFDPAVRGSNAWQHQPGLLSNNPTAERFKVTNEPNMPPGAMTGAPCDPRIARLVRPNGRVQ